MTRGLSARSLFVLAIGLLAAACGSGNGESTIPTTPNTPSDSLTFTITSAGVSPKTLTVGPGSQITFINNDVVEHAMHSDPHPEHTECTELNQVGFLSPGQSRQTGNLNTARTCRFHDHGQPFNTSLQGIIVIR
jgi:plastocyanin